MVVMLGSRCKVGGGGCGCGERVVLAKRDRGTAMTARVGVAGEGVV